MSNPTVKRIITTHSPSDKDGTDVQLHTTQLELVPVLTTAQGTAHVAHLYSHLNIPSINPHNLNEDQIKNAENVSGVVLPHGVNGQVTQLSPGFKVDYHRTSSVDYNIFLSGSAWLITPSSSSSVKKTGNQQEGEEEEEEGEERTLVKAGEIVVQTGTLHAWEAGPEGARWCTVVIAALPVEVGGKVLADVDF